MKNAFSQGGASAGYVSHPPFEKRLLRVIEKAIRRAWARLLEDPGKSATLLSGGEVDISDLLREALNDLREVRKGGVQGFSYNVFEHPHLGAEMPRRAKGVRKPDLIFMLSGRPRPGIVNRMGDAIYVECKIVETGTGKTVGAYCDSGLIRFVNGDYAAWMREGMMLGYIRNDLVLPGNLARALVTKARKKKLACDGTLTLCDLSLDKPRVYISVHKRSWKHEEGKPGPITVRHLWLPTS
jgi:hypothetical protein